MLRVTLSGLQNEELHVHITAPDEDRLEMAAERVRALLVPVDDDKNLHKQQQVRNHEGCCARISDSHCIQRYRPRGADDEGFLVLYYVVLMYQLRELAMLNGTLKDNEICHNCGEAVRCLTLTQNSGWLAASYLNRPTLVFAIFSYGAVQGHRIWNCPKREKWKPTETAIPKEAQAAVRSARPISFLTRELRSPSTVPSHCQLQPTRLVTRCLHRPKVYLWN
jgi:hypothetical protein